MQQPPSGSYPEIRQTWRRYDTRRSAALSRAPIEPATSLSDPRYVKKAPPQNVRFEINEVINELITWTRSEVVEKGVTTRLRLWEGLSPIQGIGYNCNKSS